MSRWFVGAVVSVLMVVSGSVSCRDSTGPAAVARIAIEAERTALVREQQLQLGVAVFDANDNPLEGRLVTWSSSDDDVLTVSTSGRVSAIAEGTAWITAMVEGQEDELQFVVTDGFPVLVQGFAYPFATGLAEQLRVSLRDVEGATASVVAAANGAFTVSGESATELVDIVVQGDGVMHLPALLRFPYDASTGDVRFVMTPAHWTPAVGSYTGTVVEVDPVGAFEPPDAATAENYDGFWPGAWLTGIKVFGEHLLPAPLAFDRGRSSTGSSITATDSAAFWAIVRQMEADLGRPLFRPATLSELAVASDGWADGAVLVRIDFELQPHSGYANWRWSGDDVVYAGLVRIGSAAGLANSGLVTHELLHTLGFKHSCSWPSVMGGYGCALQARMSPQDVAHAQLAFAMRKTERDRGSRYALVAALNAKLVFEHALPPVSAGLLAPWSGARLLRQPSRGGEDGAH